MYRLTTIISALLLLTSTEAFTTPSSIQKNMKTSTALNMMDIDTPANILSTVASLPTNILADAPAAPPEDFVPSYSKASYYTVLGLYVMSFPGIWSQIKRSTKAKVKRKTYISDGEAVDGGKDLRQQAGEIMACKCFLLQFLNNC